MLHARIVPHATVPSSRCQRWDWPSAWFSAWRLASEGALHWREKIRLAKGEASEDVPAMLPPRPRGKFMRAMRRLPCCCLERRPARRRARFHFGIFDGCARRPTPREPREGLAEVAVDSDSLRCPPPVRVLPWTYAQLAR